MESVFFGLAAALCWGIHDVCVRFVTARAGGGLSFLTVLGVGFVALLPLALLWADWSRMGLMAASLAVAAGAAYAGGGYALYRAFAIGPVRLVAPLIGSYPALSILWAAAQGRLPTVGQLGATGAIIAGVGLIAALSNHDGPAHEARRGAAFGWSIAAMAGFALTFALGQQASLAGGELAPALVSRGTAVLCLAGATLIGRVAILRRAVPWGLLCIMGLCDAAALTLVQSAGTLPRPEFAAVTSSTFGMITILLAWALLKERMTVPQWAAAALVFGGVGFLAL